MFLPRLSFDPLWEETESPRVFKPPSLLAGDRFLELTDADVPARISEPRFFSFWKDVLEAPPDVLDIVQNGYAVPFINGELPPPAFVENNKSALDHCDFLLEELLRLEGVGALTRLRERPRITLPCSVVYSNKWRVVCDASRQINPYVVKNKVALDSLSSVEQSSVRGDFMSKQDLSCGYFHIMLRPDMRTNFGVHYRFPSGEIWYWHWNVLFLGERNAVHLFTKILKPHRRFLAKHGVRHGLLIDDFIIMSPNFLKCLMDTQLHLSALEAAGWVVKPSKCVNHPTQRIKFLGLIKDSVLQAYFIPQEKKDRVHQQITRVLEHAFLPVRELAGLYGLLISLSKALGPIVRFLTRFGFACINSCDSWNQYVKISSDCKFELHFLLSHLDELEGYRYETVEKPLVMHCTTLASDASGVGCGVVEFTCDGISLVDQYVFTEAEAALGSTVRELIAFKRIYWCLAILFRNRSVMHYTDNLSLVRLFEIGSRRSLLHSMLFDIFIKLYEFKINLEVRWLPREDPTMQIADYYSRDLDVADYGISEQAFASLSSAWGPFDLDAFASDRNRRLSRFWSKLFSERAEGMDAFSQSWDNLHLWLCPPVSLVAKAIRFLAASSGCTGVFCVPSWPTSPFWLILVPDGVHFANLVQNYVFFSPKYYSGGAVKSRMFRGVPHWETLAFFASSEVANPLEANFSPNFCLNRGCIRCE